MLLHARQARKDLRPDSQAFYSRDGGMDIDVEYVVPLKKNSKIFSMLSADKMLTTGTAVDSGQYSAISLMPSGYFHAARRPSAASASAADREDRNLIQAIADRTADAVRAPCGARLLDLASAARRVGDHRWVILWVVYLVVRGVLGCLMVLARREAACAACPPPWSGCGSTASSPRPWPPGSTRCTWPRSSASARTPRSATRSTPGS
jgi:hypothetical protein